jgi:hypothetical protein
MLAEIFERPNISYHGSRLRPGLLRQTQEKSGYGYYEC